MLTSETPSNHNMEPSKLHMIMYFCLSPVFCFIVELISYLAFLGLFAFVILRKFCIRITFYEYLLVLWMLSIQIERIRKFVAIPNKRKRDKLKMIMQDRWNLMYLLSMLTFIVRIQKYNYYYFEEFLSTQAVLKGSHCRPQN